MLIAKTEERDQEAHDLREAKRAYPEAARALYAQEEIEEVVEERIFSRIYDGENGRQKIHSMESVLADVDILRRFPGIASSRNRELPQAVWDLWIGTKTKVAFMNKSHLSAKMLAVNKLERGGLIGPG